MHNGIVLNSLPWSGEATVVGILICILLLVAFGVLVPRWYVKAMERKHAYEQARWDRIADSVELIAKWAEKQTDVGETVTHTMRALQQQKRDGEDK